jgi:hypothetical protein
MADSFLAFVRGGPWSLPIRPSDQCQLELLKLARAHQVDSLCYWRWMLSGQASNRAAEVFSQSFWEELRISYWRHVLRNEVLVRDLVALKGAFDQKGIETIVLKGPYMGLRCFPDLGTRAIDDIDLLTFENDYRGTVEVLRGLGYEPRDALPDSPEAALLRAHYGRQLRFIAPRHRPIELHFRMINMGPPSCAEEWLWTGARDLVLGPCSIRVPGPEEMLLHVALHANQHGFAILRLLYDVHYAVAQPDLDLERFVARVQGLRLAVPVFHALLLAREMTGAQVPERLMQVLRPSALRRRIFAACWNLERVNTLRRARIPAILEAPRLYLFEMGTLREKARYLAEVVRQAGGTRAFTRSLLDRN